MNNLQIVFKKRFIKYTYKTKQKEGEEENARICIGMHGGTTICLSVHAKCAATCCTKLRCLMEIRLITIIHEVDNVRPSQLTTAYKMLNSFL